ncbi:MAG: protein phosphatase 2C domain-containing protein [Candidatus Thiodiazotropha sp.]
MSMTTPGFEWRSTRQSDKGKVRSLNEDALLDRADLRLWVVADGMGGHSSGDLASQMIVEALASIRPQNENLGSLVAEIDQRLQQVNLRLLQESQRRGDGIIGSTVVLLLAHENFCTYLWAGDSRIYLYRRGNLKQLSRDHSQVEEQLEGVFGDDQEACAASVGGDYRTLRGGPFPALQRWPQQGADGLRDRRSLTAASLARSRRQVVDPESRARRE